MAVMADPPMRVALFEGRLHPAIRMSAKLEFQKGAPWLRLIGIIGVAAASFLLGHMSAGKSPGRQPSSFPQEMSEGLLGAKPGKWSSIGLNRYYFDSNPVSYQWVHKTGDRDRRGQGAFTATTECLLHVPLESAHLAYMNERGFDLLFSFDGEGKQSKIRVVVEAIPGKDCRVAISGEGELFAEFQNRLRQIQADGEWGDDPGLSGWKYSYRAQLQSGNGRGE